MSESSLPPSEITAELLVLLAERDAIVELTAQLAALQVRWGQNPRNNSRPPR